MKTGHVILDDKNNFWVNKMFSFIFGALIHLSGKCLGLGLYLWRDIPVQLAIPICEI
jgi:hypothetical protein